MSIVDRIIDYESGMMDDDEVIKFFEELINTGMIHQLQGHYQRMACALLNAGCIHIKGDGSC